MRRTYISGERQEGALRETRSGSGLFLVVVVVVVALAAGYAQLPLIYRVSPALLPQQARISWADCARVPVPVPRQCTDAAQVSSPWRVPSCQGVRGTLSAVRGVMVGNWTVRSRGISSDLLSHEHRPCASVDAAQLAQRGLQLPKRYDETATRGHSHYVRQPRPPAPTSAPASAPAAHLGWWHGSSPCSKHAI